MYGKTRHVTISQVADAAGVARSTVSRAFTRPDLIKPETTRHVLSVAKRLGYAPNRMARALSTGHTANIALVMPHLTNPFVPPLILGIQREADLSDYCVHWWMWQSTARYRSVMRWCGFPGWNRIRRDFHLCQRLCAELTGHSHRRPTDRTRHRAASLAQRQRAGGDESNARFINRFRGRVRAL